MLKIKNIDFPKDQYYPEVCKKTQIVLHHTVSDPQSPVGDIGSWKADKARIATYGVLSYDGTFNKCFPSNMWADHLGVKMSDLKAKRFKDYAYRNKMLNMHSIAIEIDCWGGLAKNNGQILNAYGKPIDSFLEVIDCSWRGFECFQAYSDAQIEALAELLPLIMKANGIPNYGIVDGNFDVRMDALSGEPGIFSHSSYRADKSDLYPDTRLISMLNNIKL